MNKKEGIGNYKLGQKVAIYGYIDAINIDNRNDIENTTTLEINTPVKTISVNPKYEGVTTDLDKPKPMVPQFVADWIEDHKGDYSKWDEEARADFVFRAINDLFRFGEGLSPWDFTIYEEFSKWTTENAYEFITAILFGYTVKKKKRYTAKLKLTDEYLVYYASIKDLHHTKTTDNVAKREKMFNFTEDDLVKYHIWGNDNYEVKEV